MGLDMYLELNRHVSKYSGDDEETIEAIKTLGGRDLEPSSITYRAAYWRKANQIHKWFVDNIQCGNDDCGRYYVSRDDLQNLINVCKEVQADYSKVGKLLPPSEGFFFGSQDIDSGYWHDILITIEQLEKALKVSTGHDYFEYHASW